LSKTYEAVRVGLKTCKKMKKSRVIRKGIPTTELNEQIRPSKNPCGCGGMCTFD